MFRKWSRAKVAYESSRINHLAKRACVRGKYADLYAELEPEICQWRFEDAYKMLCPFCQRIIDYMRQGMDPISN